MIVIRVELWPFGDESRAKEIGRAYIANTGGTHDRGDYEVAVCRRNTTKVPKPINPEGPKPTRFGTVKNYPRLAYNMWRLIIRALRASFPEEDIRPAGDLAGGEAFDIEIDSLAAQERAEAAERDLAAARAACGFKDAEPKAADYCAQCGESPDSGTHLFGHAYEGK